jgi:dUTP pyrophosphatase
MDETFDKLNENQIAIFDQIFGALDNVIGDEDADGLKTLGAILVMPDEQFETIKPVLFDSIRQVFNTPDAKIAFAQMINQQGLRIEDFTTNMDSIVAAVDDIATEGVELSESKKDFLKFIFTTFANTMEESNLVPHRVVTIPIEVCRDGAKLPAYATNGSAAMDIYSPEEYVIGPGETVLIPTGLKVNIPLGYALLVQPRSGMSRKTKLRIANTPGLIDWDYHDEIGVIVENIDAPLKDYTLEWKDHEFQEGPLYGSSFTIGKGERFAQMRLVEVPLVNWLPVSSLGEFENDHGKGFGSTGTK